MSLTNTNRGARRQMRSVGLRDLRFASTVAAGLVAGVLGVGALSAPLLGWNDWPDQLKPGSNDNTVQMAAPALRQTFTQEHPGSGREPSGPAGIPGVGTATAAVVSAAAGNGAGAATPAAGGGSGSTSGNVTLASALSGDSVQGSGTGDDFGGSGFSAPDVRDSDGDGMPDAWEQQNQTNPNFDDRASDPDGDGISNINEFRVRTSPQRAETTAGVPDGSLDSDNDGIDNATEAALGTEPWTPTSSADGTPDAALDSDGDGIPNLDEVEAGTDPTVPQPVVEAPAPVETPAPADPEPEPAAPVET